MVVARAGRTNREDIILADCGTNPEDVNETWNFLCEVEGWQRQLL